MSLKSLSIMDTIVSTCTLGGGCLKRSAATLTIVLLLAAACAAAVGCGGNTGKARQYMTVADQSYEDAAAKGDQLQKHEEAALPALMSGDPAALLQAAPR